MDPLQDRCNSKRVLQDIGGIMPVLKLGSSGTEVTSLQQRLKELGFDPNGVDGNFGGGTQAAVIAFQRANKLEPDGKVGPGTAAALGLNNGAGSTSGATNVSCDTVVAPVARSMLESVRCGRMLVWTSVAAGAPNCAVPASLSSDGSLTRVTPSTRQNFSASSVSPRLHWGQRFMIQKDLYKS